MKTELGVHATRFLDLLNGHYPDSVLFIGRVMGGVPDATGAEVVDVDLDGFDLLMTTPTGRQEVRVGFGSPAPEPEALTIAAFALLKEARARSGESGQTSAERAMAEVGSIRTMITSVAAVRDIGPHLVEVTFAGGDLETFEPLGPDTFLYLLFPPAGQRLVIDQSFSWDTYRAIPTDVRPMGAYYTLRRWRPQAAELDIHVVTHGDEGNVSPWTRRAKPGDPVALWGPRTAWSPPTDTTNYLLVADETGLPMVAAALEDLPAGVPVEVVVEASAPTDWPELPERDGLTLTWLDRGDEPPGTTMLLADRVASLDIDPEGLFAYGGAESRAMNALRRHFRKTLGCRREQVSMVNYWRHQVFGEEAEQMA